ncbi:MRG/MORF4L-binding protein-like isoform X2 [Conger conger]|uniref:MRG/MORF4L-binding protein-like isoform X2 n=1 Tax=Conger conger TaxID=82655 RepID=UPI002A5A6CD2|nr:MRG/MORF4L-binding protein-like isoform X2 [Conger conger]
MEPGGGGVPFPCYAGTQACVNRHFHMICIRDKFCQNIGRQVSSKVIWDHLTTMYDMQALDESEILPFPNLEKSFVLPEDIIQDVKEGKLGQEEETTEDAGEEDALCASAREGSSSDTAADSPPSKEEKDRERGPSESGAAETAEKRKRNRSVEKLLGSNADPSSLSGAKRRRI